MEQKIFNVLERAFRGLLSVTDQKLGIERKCLYGGNKQKLCMKDCQVCFFRSFKSHEKSKYWSLKNKKTPRDVFKGSKQKYIFDCDKCGHEFESALKSITKVIRNTRCPFCGGQQLCSRIDCEICFEKSFISHKKSKCWSLKNKETPREVCRSSHEKYLFNCDKCNHEFESALNHITSSNNTWCPFCGGQKLCSCIDCKICFEKSFISHERSKYWSVQNKETPREVFKCSDKKYLFDCDKCLYKFAARLNDITCRNTWCPKCKHKTELKFLNHLIALYPDIQQQAKFSWCINPHTSRQLPFDFYIPSLNLIIEVDGPQHFRQISNWQSPEEQKSRDMFKINKAISNGFTIIRILQEDIFYDRNNWEINLKKELDKCPQEPDLIMIGDDKAFHTHFKCDVEIVFIDEGDD